MCLGGVPDSRGRFVGVELEPRAVPEEGNRREEVSFP